MNATNIMFEMLKQKKYITPLEKDILDTWNELQKYPFDMNSAERQVISNDINHPKIAAVVTAMPTTVPKPREQITETDLRYLLTMQLSGLIEKEREETWNG